MFIFFLRGRVGAFSAVVLIFIFAFTAAFFFFFCGRLDAAKMSSAASKISL